MAGWRRPIPPHLIELELNMSQNQPTRTPVPIPLLEWDDLLLTGQPGISQAKGRIHAKQPADFALRVANDAMRATDSEYPSYPQGSFILVDLCHEAPEHGAIVLARIHEDTVVFGMYEHYEGVEGAQHRIILSNLALPPINLCCSNPIFIGRIVGSAS